MQYTLTYLSGPWKVKGILCLPGGYGWPQDSLTDWLRRYYGTDDVQVTLTACSLSRETKDIRMRRWPALIYCRGGIGRVGRVQTHWLESFARRGYVVFAPFYRGSESGQGRDEFGGQDVEDVTAAFDLVAHLPFADPSAISMMGFSRGAINAAKAAVRLPGLRKLVLWGGVSDLAKTYEERPDLRKMLKRVLGGTPQSRPEAYRSRSPICWADEIRCPVLIIHATEDAQVDFSHGWNLYQKFRQLGADVALHRYDGYGHHMPPDVHELAITRMFRWIEDRPSDL